MVDTAKDFDVLGLREWLSVFLSSNISHCPYSVPGCYILGGIPVRSESLTDIFMFNIILDSGSFNFVASFTILCLISQMASLLFHLLQGSSSPEI